MHPNSPQTNFAVCLSDFRSQKYKTRDRHKLNPNVQHLKMHTDPMWTLFMSYVSSSWSSHHVMGDQRWLNSLLGKCLYILHVWEVWTFGFSHRRTESSKGRYILSKDGVQCAGDVVFMVVHRLFPQGDLHIGVTLKTERQRNFLSTDFRPITLWGSFFLTFMSFLFDSSGSHFIKFYNKKQ